MGNKGSVNIQSTKHWKHLVLWKVLSESLFKEVNWETKKKTYKTVDKIKAKKNSSSNTMEAKFDPL